METVTYTDPDTDVTYSATLHHSRAARGPVTICCEGQEIASGRWNGEEIEDIPIPDLDGSGAYWLLSSLSQLLRDGGQPRCGRCGGLPDECYGCPS